MHADSDLPLLGERWRDALININRNAAESDVHIDSDAVRRHVSAHARGIGCTESNVLAACNYGLRNGSYTLACIREGNTRAAILRARQPAEPAES